MSRYKGMFTFDVDNHRYIPIEQADGIISDMNYHPEPEEEQKEYWYINEYGSVMKAESYGRDTIYDKSRKNFGNYFETKEEAEKVVEKLVAWKRLKDKGIRITLRRYKGCAWLDANWENLRGDFSDVLLLFGGEE